ncbi:hypothetical protein SHEWT2_00380 [Shewanella hafniensis]|nr:hypothetical protein SHEWT2_00380 [Shewanella hafniensis]
MTIVYLDQNIWIQLARIKNGIESTPDGINLLKEIEVARSLGFVFPLSAIHLMEFSRINDDNRRTKLGKVMWEYSGGVTTKPLRELLHYEIEVAFSKLGYKITPKKPSYLGRGFSHAFGEKLDSSYFNVDSEAIDKAMLCGYGDVPPVQGSLDPTYRDNFNNHLHSIHEKKLSLDKSKWDDWMYALSMADIVEPLREVMIKHQIPSDVIESWDRSVLKSFMDSIPTRRLDIHLHKQVLKNAQYRPKHSDLEDWAGLVPALCYADIVVCERHFADMARRENYKHHARIETSIYSILKSL